MKIILSLLLCLPSFAHSQDSRSQQVEVVSDYLGGLNTAYPSSIIQPNQAQDARNVFFDNGYLEKRGGSRKQNASAIGGGADVNALYEYRKSDGTDYCVAFSSTTGYYSTDGCASFTMFMSSFTADYDMNCVPFTDRLYCVNGVDTSFYLDGTSYVADGSIPTGKYLMAYQNRLWLAGEPTQKSYVYFSDVGDGDEWDTTLQYVGFNPEDGDVITGIGEPIFETLPVYKKYSSWVVNGNSADNYTPVMINSSIGASHHRSIKNFLLKNSKNIQLFSSDGSRGSEPGIYSFNGIVIEYLSDKIRNQFRDFDTFNALTRYKQWTTAADWGGGTSVFISSTQDSGVIEGAKFSTITTTASDWEAVNLVNIDTTTSGQISIYITSATDVFDDFSDLDFSNPTWVQTSGVWTAANARAEKTGQAAGELDNSTFTWVGGAISFDFYQSGSDYLQLSTNYLGHTTTFETNNGSFGTLLKFANNNGTFNLCTGAAPVAGSTATAIITYLPSQGWSLNTTYGISCSSSGYSGGPYEGVQGTGQGIQLRKVSGLGVAPYWDNIKTTGKTATWTSPVYDTLLSTTIGGPFEVTDSTDAGEYIWYYVRESTKNVSYATEPGVWSSWAATSDTLRIPLTKQYWQYKADFQTDYSTHTPILYDVTLQAISTGTWTSAETLLDSAISTWGLFQASEITSGSGSWSYEIRSSTTAGETALASWSSIANNTTIAISTGAYVQVRATSDVYTSTDDAKVDSITVNYNVGAVAKSPTAAVYRNRYYWFGQDQDSSYNNVGFAIDSNGAWTKLTGINARSAAIIGGDLYTGVSSTTSGGFIYQQDVGSDDDGQAIDSYWQSKDYLLGSDDYLKAVNKIYLTYPNSNSTLNVQLNADGTEAKSWDVQLSTSATFGVKPLVGGTTSGIRRGKYFNVKVSNNSIYDWKIMGFRMYWTPLQVLSP